MPLTRGSRRRPRNDAQPSLRELVFRAGVVDFERERRENDRSWQSIGPRASRASLSKRLRRLPAEPRLMMKRSAPAASRVVQ